MEEPFNIDRYYVTHGTIVKDGKRGYGKVKKWYDEEKKAYIERILTFDPYPEVEGSES